MMHRPKDTLSLGGDTGRRYLESATDAIDVREVRIGARLAYCPWSYYLMEQTCDS